MYIKITQAYACNKLRTFEFVFHHLKPYGRVHHIYLLMITNMHAQR